MTKSDTRDVLSTVRQIKELEKAGLVKRERFSEIPPRVD
jgi:DNA-binding HxlR family transcriptional regulator